MKIVFMGTPDFAVPALEAIHGKHQVLAVYSQPDKPSGRGLDLKPTPVKAKALELGVPVFQPEKLNTAEELARLQQLNPDLIVVVAYGKILRKSFLDLPRLGCINIHSSLLPRWRGAAPIQWAILGGDAESGVSIMHLVEELDAGDVLMQAKTPIRLEDTAGTLHDRLAKMGAELILPTLEGLEKGTLKGQPQDKTKVTYAEKLTKEMETLSPQASAQVLFRRVQALNPWPGTSIWIKPEKEGSSPQRLKVKRAIAHPEIQVPPSLVGKIYEKVGMILFGTIEGALELQLVQWDGKKEVDASSFLNGLKGRGMDLPLKAV